ncbi:hypothetical protein JL720_14449 [Aureococcus anophagefferens]|nr:hypothetical protein JL720_14449 [Aureococcus anophagefferens]
MDDPTANQKFRAWSRRHALAVADFQGFAFGDVDGDGWPDMATATSTGIVSWRAAYGARDTIEWEAGSDAGFGTSVSMSADGATVAAGAATASPSGDATVLAIGAPRAPAQSSDGFVHVYAWDGAAWTKRGDDVFELKPAQGKFGSVVEHENLGPGRGEATFATNTGPIWSDKLDSSVRSVAVADLDGDGDVDIVVGADATSPPHAQADAAPALIEVSGTGHDAIDGRYFRNRDDGFGGDSCDLLSGLRWDHEFTAGVRIRRADADKYYIDEAGLGIFYEAQGSTCDPSALAWTAKAGDLHAPWNGYGWTIERVASETVYEYLEYPVGLGMGWCESGYVFGESSGRADYEGPKPIPLVYCKALRGGGGCYPNSGYNVYVRYAAAEDVAAVSLYLAGSGTARLDVYDADDVDDGRGGADPPSAAGLTSVAASAATAFDSGRRRPSEVRFADFSPPLSFSDARTEFYVWLRAGDDLDARGRGR